MIAHHPIADIYHSPGLFMSAHPDFINRGTTSRSWPATDGYSVTYFRTPTVVWLLLTCTNRACWIQNSLAKNFFLFFWKIIFKILFFFLLVMFLFGRVCLVSCSILGSFYISQFLLQTGFANERFDMRKRCIKGVSF